jgi:hypothetical protein
MFRIKVIYDMPSGMEKTGVYYSSALRNDEIYDCLEGMICSHIKRGWERDRHHGRRLTKGDESVEFCIVRDGVTT